MYGYDVREALYINCVFHGFCDRDSPESWANLAKYWTLEIFSTFTEVGYISVVSQ